MLHRSFKGGKCKTSLKLAVARIKLLRNKRETQLRQMKRDLAQLLEAGQEKTARIRVEHVVREEKTMAAYDLIDIYCELIVARLPIIESQKTCPIDLKEAITSVIFASPRCADLPELLDVRKHFTAKYGKEFVAAALELRPECGVNRTMVEKLSARAPDGETKIKILTAIAQEHNVNWDPTAVAEEELKPSEDLLKGPATFGTTNKPVESPRVPLSPTPDKNYESSVDISEKRSSLNSQGYASVNTTSSMAQPNTSHFESRASESRREETEFRDSSSSDRNASFNRQNWNMEFKDATSAAQAAAESAERASMAARAAAELSSLGKYRGNSSTDLHESSGYGFRDEGPRISTGPSVKGEHESVRRMYDSQTSSSHHVDPRIQIQQGDRNDMHNQQESAGSMHDAYGSINRRSSQSEGPRISTGPSVKGEHESVRRMHDSQTSSSHHVDPRRMYDSQTSSSHHVDPRIQIQQGDRNDIHNQQGSAGSMNDAYGSINRRSSQSVSPGLPTAAVDDDMVDNHQREDRYYQKSSSEVESNNTNRQGRKPEKGDFLREISGGKKQPSQSQVEYIGEPQNNKTEYTDFSAERKIRKQSSKSASSPSHYHLSPDDDDILDPDIQNDRNYGREHSFSNTGLGNVQKGTQLSPNDYRDVHFDEYGSDEEPSFGVQDEYNVHDSDSYDPSPVRKSPSHFSPSTRTSGQYRDGSLKDNASVKSDFNIESHSPSSFHETPTKSAVASKSFDFIPATFDESDGLSSESEEEIDHYKTSGRTETSTLPPEQNIFTRIPEPTQMDRGHGSTKSSNVKKETVEDSQKPGLYSSYDNLESEDRQAVRLNVGGQSVKTYSGYGSNKSSFTENQATGTDRKSRLPSSFDDLESESAHSLRNQEAQMDGGGESRKKYGHDVLPFPNRTSQAIRLNVGDESVNTYSGHGSKKSSFTGKEAAGIDRKPRLPSSDDSDSESAHSLRNQEAQMDGGGGKARKTYGHDVLPFPNRTSQTIRLNVGDESVNTYSGHGSKKSSITEKEAAGTERKTRLPSSSDDSESESAHLSKNQEAQLDVGDESRRKSGHGGLTFPGRTRSPRNLYQEPVFDQVIEEKQTLKPSRLSSAAQVQAKEEFYAPKSPDAFEDSESSSFLRRESGQGLNFGRLTGGIRNKGNSRRTYNRGPSSDASPPSRQQRAENTPTVNEQPTASPTFKSSIISQARDQELYTQKQQIRQELGSRSPRTSVDSDSDDAEVLTDRIVGQKGYTSGGLSRRKKDSPAESDASRLSNVSVTSRIGMRRKEDSSVEQKTPKSMPQREVSTRKESSRPRLQKTNPTVEQEPSKPVPEPEIIASVTTKTLPETVASGSTKNAKPSLSNEGDSSRENSFKKAGHVHPKLPDYDSFAAHFEALKSNRRSS